MSGSIGAGANSGVALGSVYLTGFEVPDTIAWGTKQGIKEHIYPGGQNVLQALGPTRNTISWSGQMFSEPTKSQSATDRAQAIDQMVAAGALIPLAWGSLNCDVVVEEFRADYKHEWQGKYTISCKVQWDYTPTPAAPSPAVATSNDLGSAAGLAPQSLLGAVANVAQSALTLAQSAVTIAQIGIPIPGALIAAEASIQAGITAIGQTAAIAGAAVAGGVLGPLTVAGLTVSAGISAQCASAFGYVARAATNWMLVPGISTPFVPPQTTPPDLAGYTGA